MMNTHTRLLGKRFSILPKMTALGLSIMLLGLGCQSSGVSKTPSSVTNTKSATYTKGNTLLDIVTVDLPSLVKESVLIVRGKVTKVMPSYLAAANVVIKGEKAAEEFRVAKPGVGYMVVSEDVTDVEFRELQSNADKNRWILTDIEFVINKKYSGAETKETITIQEMGGKVGDREMYGEDLNLLSEGEDVILFLTKSERKGSEDKYVILTWQGTYRIKNEDAISKDEKRTKKLKDLEKEIEDLLAAKEQKP